VARLLAPAQPPYHLQISAGQALLSFRLRRKKMLTLVLSPTSYMTQLQQLPGFLSRCNAQKSLSAMQSLVAQESLLEIHVTCQEELIPYFEMNDFQLEIEDKEEGVEGYHLMWHLSL